MPARIRPPYSRLITAVCLLLAQCAFAAPQLNGVAIYSELGAEQFIAGFYCETPTSDPRNALLDKGDKRIDIRVLTQDLLSNRFKRMWREGVAINASPTELQQQAQTLADFINLLNIKLQRDDVLSISAEGANLVVQLNKIELGRFNNRPFFDILLRTWIGPVPLSSEFRESLLSGGKIAEKPLSIYSKVEATPQRVTAIKTALAASAKKTAAEQAASAKAESSAAALALAETSSASSSKKSKTAASSSSEAAPPPLVATAVKSTSEARSSAPAVATPIASIAPTPPAVAKPAAANAIFENESDSTQETADSLLVQQLYISKLAKRAAGFVKYPADALEKKQTGSIRMLVTINRSGAITQITTATASEYAVLNQAAEAAVKAAAPYPPIPDDIKSDSFVFSVPIAFKIKSK